MVVPRSSLIFATCIAVFGATACGAQSPRPSAKQAIWSEPATYEAVGDFSGPRPTIDMFENYMVHGKSGDSLKARLGQPESSTSFFISSRDNLFYVEAGKTLLPLFKMNGRAASDFSERHYSCHPTERGEEVQLACRSSLSGSTYELTYERDRGITSFDYLCDIMSFSTCRYVLVSPVGFLSSAMIQMIKVRRTGSQ